MKHYCVRDDGIGDRAKSWKRLQERFKRVETPQSGDFDSTNSWPAVRSLWGFGEFIHQSTRVAHRATRRRGSSFRDPFQRLGPQWSV